MECARALEEAVSGRLAAQMAERSEEISVATPSSWGSDDVELNVSLEVLLAALKSISSDATKFGLVYSSPPKLEEGRGICSELLDGCDHLITSAKVGSLRGGGPLCEFVRAASRQVLSAVEAMARECSVAKAGALSETCEAWRKRLPKSNRTAYRRKFLGFVGELKDSIAEFRDLAAQEVDEDGGLDAYGSEDERRAAIRLLACLETAGCLFKVSMAKIDERGKAGDFDAVAQTYACASRLHRAAITIAEALYPPLHRNIYSDLNDVHLAVCDLRHVLFSADNEDEDDVAWRARLDAANVALESLPEHDGDSG